MSPTRQCTGPCGQRKPWTEFHAAARWPDGTMRRPQSRCKACAAEARKQALRRTRRDDPEAARARDRREWKAIQASPDRARKRRRLQQENSSAFRERQRQPRIDAVLNELGNGRTAGELVELTGLPLRSVVEALKWLRELGRVEQAWSGRRTAAHNRIMVWRFAVDDAAEDARAADAARKRAERACP
jgi:DNA-binding transcriptional ArsR family regulator